LDDDLFTDPLLDRLLLDERLTAEREELLLLVLFTPDEDDLLLFVMLSKAALPNVRPSDLKNPDVLLCLLLLLFPIRFGTTAFVVLLFTAVRFTDLLKRTDLRLIVVFSPTLIRFPSLLGAT
jgi:hypothetical protein